MINDSRILIVDDAIDNIHKAISILERDYCNISFALNGAEALKLMIEERNSFDLILLDILMPGLDGFKVCRLLKQQAQTRAIPVVLLTTGTEAEPIERGFQYGAADYLTKPFKPAELLARVKAQLALSCSRRLVNKYALSFITDTHREIARLVGEVEDTQKEMMCILAGLMEAISDETGKHIKRVAESTALLAKYHPALDEEERLILYYAAPMHDIGKIMVPVEILHKEERYTAQDFAIMKNHAQNAYQLLCQSERKLLKAAAVIAHEHHEKWDGSGYPRGLKGEQIHLYGRIVALTDVFDALLHKRHYKQAWTVKAAVNYVLNERGRHFDPDLVDMFKAHVDEFIEIAVS